MYSSQTFLWQSNASEEVKLGAAAMLSELRSPMLRFLADPYDDTTSTIFPLLSNLLQSVRFTRTQLFGIEFNNSF